MARLRQAAIVELVPALPAAGSAGGLEQIVVQP
jgi:hypothetical protein